ncbi:MULTISPECIES: site-specific integrase [unclassified Marinobacter]|jgi:site-specific recombinase XerD|uniref:site-specific integrase n=1 Tax=unclassified Marinobacter TaxID=83889 RepID=UPI00200F5775|nr:MULTISPECIES: site-specific integrase [unclassified Marinobacter]MCL1488072.1 site-specific integrase [Marinobacter sp.]UQG55098.1 site-specific integrase [Marinobacter sp. M4C]UQG55101.1 site-specific integrase [Marinobacter sp. M4C]UQG55918.1 site-specific integrase [Marinobacter sp. M4C]UQG57293.1 site-specific integrase [Marinobacter sp. M4C]
MLDSAYSKHVQRTSEWFAGTVLGSSEDPYVKYLAERGYASGTIEGYSRSVAHFAHWSRGQDVHLSDMGEALVKRFIDEHLLVCRCATRCRRARKEVRAALGHLLKMLRSNGQCRPKISVVPAPIAAQLEDFEQHLADVRGLAPTTRLARARHLRDFLIDSFGAGPVQLSLLGPADVIRFFAHYTAAWAPASISTATSSLKTYFAFRASQGEQTAALIASLPQVAQWRLSGLPQVLSTKEVEQFLNAFDRRHATGKRDYAIARCLLDLGLRRTEVARLQLDDVDWRAGTLYIHGKGRRIDILPLPDATGRAIAQYLQDGRPQTTRRELFVRHRPPLNAPADPDIIRNAIRNAAQRCGLGHRIRGTHILRHTLAGRLVHSGARFKEIADLLRHRSLDTTTIYAKVDIQALAQVALPWPGRKS